MPPPCDLDLLTLKSVWESHVTWGTPVQSFVFLGLLVFELEPMYATSDRWTVFSFIYLYFIGFNSF